MIVLIKEMGIFVCEVEKKIFYAHVILTRLNLDIFKKSCIRYTEN